MTTNLDPESRTELMADVATELTDEHDSDMCAQGTDGRLCWMCEWANSAERRQALKKLAEAGVFSARPCAMSVHDLAAVRRAILSTLDDGDPTVPNTGCPLWNPAWRLYAADEDDANAQRLAFCDAVSEYIISRLT
jgi:hypothetical protein